MVDSAATAAAMVEEGSVAGGSALEADSAATAMVAMGVVVMGSVVEDSVAGAMATADSAVVAMDADSAVVAMVEVDLEADSESKTGRKRAQVQSHRESVQ